MQTKIDKKDLKLIHQMAVHKIKLQFSDQLFGYAWAIINPLVFIFSYWFFFVATEYISAPISPSAVNK